MPPSPAPDVEPVGREESNAMRLLEPARTAPPPDGPVMGTISLDFQQESGICTMLVAQNFSFESVSPE